ncbi:aminotransferase class I/II-fold pyridoxal phosphate-dependent enzyme [Alteribacillus sp. HJP-4]|uniref:methionine gamma-lyase family protein n=1 Tax=Alteribacillus sp. HJP-4 TaxID=2775394 RepID=UPI0035CD0B06
MSSVENSEQLLNSWKAAAEKNTETQRAIVAETAEINQDKILRIFREEKVSAFHFHASTGYGYDDAGRDTLDRVYAKVFGTEAAIVRHQFISGTHAITAALFGILRPGERLLYATGDPYDTLKTALGLTGREKGTFLDYGIETNTAPLDKNGEPDIEAILSRISPHTKVIAIQRSRGYDNRQSLSVAAIEELIHKIKNFRRDLIIFVDNCYGEFVEQLEPGHAGADLIAGSLIKNPGGGLARCGGYIAGRRELVEQASSRFAAPGIGLEGAATLGVLQEMFQGIFLAPHIVSQALQGAVFTAALLEKAGLKTSPSPHQFRTDLIQSVTFYDKERMVRFCQAIQEASPVDANVVPQSSAMPGYGDEVIMAAGTFIQGSSIELSADGPLRKPFTAYVQGGLTYAHVKIAVTHALKTLLQHELLESRENQ